MKNGNSERDLDSVVRLLRRQDAKLDVLLRHVACTEATLTALILKSLPKETLTQTKEMKDFLDPIIYFEIKTEIKCKLDE